MVGWRAAAHWLIVASSESPSMRCTVRRMHDSLGAVPPPSSAASTWTEAFSAHSPIAANYRHPASTAHTANPRIAVM